MFLMTCQAEAHLVSAQERREKRKKIQLKHQADVISSTVGESSLYSKACL